VELQLRNINGEVIGEIEVRDDVFGIAPNVDVVHQVMVAQLANQRQGTHKAKTRAQVSGGGIKPRPQKYTGRARQGSIRSPQWRGGGIVFGPAPRSYRQNTPKRMRRLALLSALSDKVRSDNLVVVDSFTLAANKTKEMARALSALGAQKSALIVADGANPELFLCARNLPKVHTSPAAMLNTLDLLNAQTVIMTVDAVRKAEELWGGPFTRKKAPVAAATDGD
jgi:large subunit ribosomal protein L4